MALTLVLSVGLDPELLSTRSFILQAAGYIVVSAYSIKAAVNRFQEGDFDLVLLCQSIPTKDRDRLTCWIRESGSRIPVVSVSEKLCQNDASTVVTVGSNPDALLMGMREVLISAQISAAWTATFPDKHGVSASPGKKPPGSRDGYERRTRATNEYFAPLAHAG